MENEGKNRREHRTAVKCFWDRLWQKEQPVRLTGLKAPGVWVASLIYLSVKTLLRKSLPTPKLYIPTPQGWERPGWGRIMQQYWLWVRLRFASILSPGFNHLLAARSRASESSALPDPHCPYLYKEEKSTHCRPKIRKSITGGSIFFWVLSDM